MVGDVNLFISNDCEEAEIEVMVAGRHSSSTVAGRSQLMLLLLIVVL